MEGFLMVTKYKSRIALAACLLLAQSTPIIQAGGNPYSNVNLDFSDLPGALVKSFAGYLAALSGTILLLDGVLDLQYRGNRNFISEKRKNWLDDSLRAFTRAEHTEDDLKKRAAQAIPDSVPTSPKVRILKALSGALLTIGGAWLAYNVLR